MNRLIFLVLLVPLFPLMGSFWNQISVMILAGLSWAIMLGTLMNIGDHPLKWIFLAQLPLLALLTYVSLQAAKQSQNKQEEATEDSLDRSFKEVENLHQSLKKDVTRGEKEEQQSLAIYGAAKGLAEALSWKDLAPRLTSSIQKIFGAYEFLLFAFDEEGNRKLLHRRGGWSKDFPIDGDIPIEPSIFLPVQSSEVVPLLTVPISTGKGDQQRINGLLILKHPTGDESDKSLMDAGKEFGEQLGMALNKGLLFAQMETHSQIDGLTGIFRRQPFMDRLAQEFKRAVVFRTPFSLMMVDIDFFKVINDSHGHEAGDLVLKRVGEILKSSVYETDVVGRYGGEEFIILFPKAQADGVLRKAEQLRSRIEHEVIPFGFEKLKLTVSIGVAHYPTSAHHSDTLIAKADQALYRAKESGRNKVVEG